MLSNYFFVPVNKQKYLIKSEQIREIDYRIFDFEDSILNLDIDSSIQLLKNINKRDTDWIRIPLSYDAFKKIIVCISQLGYQNFVIPKFKGIDELTLIINTILEVNKNAKFILLIENPRALMEIERILKMYSDCIHAIGLGIHDFSLVTGIVNDIDFFRNIRIYISILAKAYEIEAIDVVSMNISNISNLENDIIDGFNCGYRAKFLIHPFQLKVLKSIPFYTYDEVKKYLEILRYYKNNIQGHDALFVYEGNVYEKMHIQQIKKIVKWGKDFYGTNW